MVDQFDNEPARSDSPNIKDNVPFEERPVNRGPPVQHIEQESDSDEDYNGPGWEQELPEDGKPRAPKRLSYVSSQYDLDGKGYLTEVEQQMRSMDRLGQGYLTNAQVAQVVEQTMEIQEQNYHLRRWVIAMLLAVLILAVSNMGTAVAAARLAKDTQVESDSGRLTVKGNPDLTVITESAGYRYNFELKNAPYGDDPFSVNDGSNTDGAPHVCIPVQVLAEIFDRSSKGMDIAFAMEANRGTDQERFLSLGLDRTGAMFSNNGVVVKTYGLDANEISQITFDFTSNACSTGSNNGNGRSLKEVSAIRYEEFFSHLTNDHLKTRTTSLPSPQNRRELCASGNWNTCIGSSLIVPGFLGFPGFPGI